MGGGRSGHATAIVNRPARRHPVLCLNSGSSSVKFALYELDEADERLLADGAVERIGLEGAHAWVRSGGHPERAGRSGEFPDHRAAVQAVFEVLGSLGLPPAAAVGHRVVHGGPEHLAPARVDRQLLEDLRGLIPFAPLHLPSEIQGIEAVARRFPGLPQVACFDTAFHRRLPEVAQRFPLPRALWEAGVRRYGFHGLSYEYVVAALGPAADGRVIIAHLGNGASLAAVRRGQPLDTTMGLTPTAGVMMGTRSGDLDPGVLVYLMREQGFGPDDVERCVTREAGLLGVSGLSPDMKILLELRERDARAAQAVALFCYQVRKHIGALAAVLGGLDTLVFTAGIGERAAAVRWEVCQGLEHLDIRLDPEQNRLHAETISTPGSRCTVRVIPTREDLMIARHTHAVLVGHVAPEREDPGYDHRS